MTAAWLQTRAQTKNAKVGAVVLALAAFATLLLTHTATSLAPLRLLTLAAAAFAVWAFGDEMGLEKPLNRAGMVCFAIAVFTKVQLALGVEPAFVPRYGLLYAGFLMLSLLLWSVAFLHRQRTLKLVGAAGLLATLLPILAIVLGHLFVGLGALIGIDALLDAAASGAATDLGFVTVVERIFGLWGYVAAWLLWRGHIVDRRALGQAPA